MRIASSSSARCPPYGLEDQETAGFRQMAEGVFGYTAIHPDYWPTACCLYCKAIEKSLKMKSIYALHNLME
jgi:hypothetical protein